MIKLDTFFSGFILKTILFYISLHPCFARQEISPTVLAVETAIHLSQISSTKWRVNYQFNQPITAMDFGPSLSKYRAQSWKLVSSNSHSPQILENNQLFSNQYFNQIEIEITLKKVFPEDNYRPMVPFSDGAVAFDLGQLNATVKTQSIWRPIQAHFQFNALHPNQVQEFTQNVPSSLRSRPAYVYFGQGIVQQLGHFDFILDPQLPPWIKEIFLSQSLSRLVSIYQQKLNQEAPENIVVMVASSDLDRLDVHKIIGGEIDGQLIFSLVGKAFTIPSQSTRQQLLKIMAHEIAHLWQPLDSIDPQQSEIHEGGAEILAVNALVYSGLWTLSDKKKFVQQMKYLCPLGFSKLPQRDNASKVTHHACAYLYFEQLKIDPFKLWKKLLQQARSNHRLLNQTLINEVLALLIQN